MWTKKKVSPTKTRRVSKNVTNNSHTVIHKNSNSNDYTELTQRTRGVNQQQWAKMGDKPAKMGNSNENREIKHQSWWLWICAILGNPILAHARMWIRPPVNSVDSWLVGFFSWTLYLYSSFQCFNNEWTIHSWKSALVCFNALGQTSTLDQVLANENLQGCKFDISIYGYHLMCIPRTVAKKPVRTSDYIWPLLRYLEISRVINKLEGCTSLYDSTVWRRHRSWKDQLEKPRTHCIPLLSATFGFPWEFRISGMCPATLLFWH